jgi:hypothetical protein
MYDVHTHLDYFTFHILRLAGSERLTGAGSFLCTVLTQAGGPTLPPLFPFSNCRRQFVYQRQRPNSILQAWNYSFEKFTDIAQNLAVQ